MIFNGRQTIYNIMLMNRMLAGLEYRPPINTTVNEKLNILLKNKSLDKYPKINTLIIGSFGGVLKSDLTRLRLYQDQHNPTDASLFNQIPFYLRRLDEVAKKPLRDYHVLRKRVVINGTEYLAAYGRAIEEFEYKDEITYLKNITDDYANIYKDDVNHLKSMSPEPVTNLDMTFKSDSFVNDFIKTYIYLDAYDLNELYHVFETLGIEEPVINEMGVCAGKWVETKDILGNLYKETIETQIMYFLDSDINLNEAISDRDYIDFYIEIGGQQILRMDK